VLKGGIRIRIYALGYRGKAQREFTERLLELLKETKGKENFM